MATKSVDSPVSQVTDQNPIINDAFSEPTGHWEFSGKAPTVAEGRRPAGYLPAVPKGQQMSFTSETILLEQVNTIRDRVREWRESDYPGATAVTRTLFNRWFDDSLDRRPFFAQREAMETIAWLTEAPADKRVGIRITKYEEYERWATKLATGTGKTMVMGLVILWSGLNKLANRQDTRFTDAFLVVAPNLTVKDRLSGEDGIAPAHPASVYVNFALVPPEYESMVGQLKVQITNWHQLAPKTDPKRSVLRRGPESDAAFARRVLKDLGNKKNIMVINDEAHHAWRPPPDYSKKVTGEDKEELQQATVWIDGLQRLHRDRGLLRCLDFSATPMYPGQIGGEKAWTPFEWVISDFGLVDAIESGLVKIPRVPTDDNAEFAIPKYRNLWEHVKKSLPKRGDDPEEGHSVLDYLCEVDGPLKQLSSEWDKTHQEWTQAGREVPPVMIVVCNDTKMAEVLDVHIAKKGEVNNWFRNDPDDPRNQNNTVRIDSSKLKKAESRDDGESASDAEERLRRMVATVGKKGLPGEDVRCLISVGMLSEGWSAQNVTQILGLRAFQSQLLCEQVVGRGLRRSDYSDLSQPEYVDVYGVPFQLLPFAKGGTTKPVVPPKVTQVSARRERADLRIDFPRVDNIISDVGDEVSVDFGGIEPVVVTAAVDPTSTYVEFELGKSRSGMGGTTQDREAAYARYRRQRLEFQLAAQLTQAAEGGEGKPWLFPQFLQIVHDFIDEKVTFEKEVDERELSNLRYHAEIRNRILEGLRSDLADGLVPVLNEYQPIGSTDGISFTTVKPCSPTKKSHVSHVVADSGLETKMADVLEKDARVVKYVKNDRLFFEVRYRHLGKGGSYRPDFIVVLSNGLNLVLEGKGRKTEQDDAKVTAMNRWIAAVNRWGQMGEWDYAICKKESDVTEAIDAALAKSPAAA